MYFQDSQHGHGYFVHILFSLTFAFVVLYPILLLVFSLIYKTWLEYKA